MTRARDIANFGDGIATADIGDGQITTAKIASGAITDALLPAGSVLQVVQGTYSTAVSATSTSYVDTGLSASITPSSASSKILVMTTQQIATSNASAGSYQVIINLLRDSTQIIESFRSPWVNSERAIGSRQSITYLDSPNTTNSITYKTQFRSPSGGQTSIANMNDSDASIILMEIAG